MRPVWLSLSLAASSLGNVIPVLGAASSGNASLVGALGILTASYVIALCVARGLVCEPLLLKAAELPGREAAAAGATVLVGVLAATLLSAAAALIIGGEWAAVGLLGAALPFLLLQDVLRYIAIARRKPYHAAVSDWIWVGVTAIGTWMAVRHNWLTPAVLLGAWVSGGVSGLIYLLSVLGVLPSSYGAWVLLRHDRALRLHLAGDALLTTGSLQISLLIAAAVAGLAGVGLVRLLQTMFGPVTLLFSVLYVEFVARHRLDERGLSPLGAAVRMACILTLVTTALAVGVATLPESVSRRLGDVFNASTVLLVPFTIGQITAGLGTAAVTGLRLADRAGIATAIRGGWAAALLAGTFAGGSMFGTRGYVWAWALVHLATAVAWWHQLSRAQAVAITSPLPTTPLERN